MTGEFKGEVDRRLVEGVERIENCLGRISQDELWQKPGPELVSIGNLVNHLCGNITQWVLKGLGGVDFQRERDREFIEITDESAAVLSAKIRSIVDQARGVVAGMSEADLKRAYSVQGYQETGVGILLHVVEHLSYHVGQITFYVKLIRGVDVGYYSDQDL